MNGNNLAVLHMCHEPKTFSRHKPLQRNDGMKLNTMLATVCFDLFALEVVDKGGHNYNFRIGHRRIDFGSKL